MTSILAKIASRLYAYGKKSHWKAAYEGYRKIYQIAPSFKFNGPGTLMYGEGSISLGENSYVGYDCFMQAVQGCKIKIGSYCSISHNVKMYTSSYATNQDFIQMDRRKKEGDISIGDGVWIGVNVLINPGVSIGDNAIVGANAVITKDVPAFAIAAGVPAEVIKYKAIADGV
jgi:maltose O-acetyltransferase